MPSTNMFLFVYIFIWLRVEPFAMSSALKDSFMRQSISLIDESYTELRHSERLQCKIRSQDV